MIRRFFYRSSIVASPIFYLEELILSGARFSYFVFLSICARFIYFLCSHIVVVSYKGFTGKKSVRIEEAGETKRRKLTKKITKRKRETTRLNKRGRKREKKFKMGKDKKREGRKKQKVMFEA